MRSMIIVLFAVLVPLAPANAQVGVAINAPGVSIGINMPSYPDLVPIPGYPVYYDPQVSSNYFFYDGLYWVYNADNWYASTWYNGPWQAVAPEEVPVYVLRVPVRYYRQPPVYFRGWSADAPPRWGEHWGNDWSSHHAGWDKWDRRSAPAAAPLPVYQRQYSGDRYPRAIEQQQTLRTQNYHYQPREAVTKQEFQQRGNNAGTAQNATPQPAAAPAQAAVKTPPKPRVQAEHKAPAAQNTAVAGKDKAPAVVQHQPAVAVQQPKQPQQTQHVEQAQHAKPVQQAQQAKPVQQTQHVERVQPAQHVQQAQQGQNSAQAKGQHPAAAGGPEHKAPQQHESPKNNGGGAEKANAGKKEEHG